MKMTKAKWPMLIVGGCGREYKSFFKPFLRSFCKSEIVVNYELKTFSVGKQSPSPLGGLLSCAWTRGTLLLPKHSPAFLWTLLLLLLPSLLPSVGQKCSEGSQNNNMCVDRPTTVFPPPIHSWRLISWKNANTYKNPIYCSCPFEWRTPGKWREKKKKSFDTSVAISQEPSGSFTASVILVSLH